MATPNEQVVRAGRAVEARLDELGLSLPKAARAAGIHPNTLRRFLHGENWPKQETMTRLAGVLGWPAGEIARRSLRDGETVGLDAYPVESLVMELCRRLNGTHR